VVWSLQSIPVQDDLHKGRPRNNIIKVKVCHAQKEEAIINERKDRGIERLYLFIFHWTQGPFSMKYCFYTV